MDDFWNALTGRHRNKVIKLAENHQVSVERAFRNILRQAGAEFQLGNNLKELENRLTIRHVEKMIDSIDL
jgi:hypothetical protein